MSSLGKRWGKPCYCACGCGSLAAHSTQLNVSGSPKSWYKYTAGHNARATVGATKLVSDAVALAYAAGIIDGEGCIGTSTNRKVGYAPIVQVRVAVAMCSKVVTLWLKETFGGCWAEYPNYVTEGGRPRFMWHASGTNAGIVLRQLLPFLREKHRQAEVALEILTGYKKWGGNNGHRVVGDVERARRLQLADELARLKTL